ncbi:MAG TPA: hypothetical protein DIW30_03240 [Bacteroidales bacterium]|nr:hypothetical protein [Bacteroidales bacterium]
MNNRFLSLFLCLLLALCGAQAAQKKKTQHKKLTKTYVNVPLQEVLQDIGKRTDYIIDYSEADLDLAAPVNRKFKEASALSAIRKILGKQYIVKAKRSVIKITNIPVPPVTFQSPALQPSVVEEDEEKIVKTYQDTTFSVVCKMVTQRIEPEEQPAPEPTQKGHYVQTMLGAGYGSMGYSLRDDAGTKVGKNLGDFSGLLQVQYACYFHENWGFNVGIAFSGYGSYGRLNNTNRWNSVGDSDGELYNHLALTHDWTEQQVTHIVELPVGIQCQYPVNDKNWRLYAGVGIRVGMPVYSKWALKSGSLEHQGDYPQWGMLIKDQTDRDFYTEQIGSEFVRDRHELHLKKVALAADAKMGLMIPLSKQLDLLCGAYFQMNCLNLNNEQQQPVGWQQPAASVEDGVDRRHAFMNEYKGELASDFVKAVRPWAVGLTVGISWHHIPKPKPAEPTYEKYQLCDTTFSLQPRQEIVRKPKKEAAKQIVRLMHKSVIWFDVNSVEPKLQPADILDKIAAVLIENPDQKIIVSGHASKEGSARKNRILSENRAKAIADMLVAKGVSVSQIQVEAHSSDIQYDAGEGSVHTIALDRRTEIIPVDENPR